uniref:hypothetical protein n=1 Tax=Acinetobacter bereziniae TaxID=106648 RepID=UPI00300BE3C6
LFGGLHSTKYVSDPNQWIDPMGLKDDAAMIARYTGKRSTQKDFADLATTWGDWADYGSVACTIPSPCTPAVPVLKTAGTGLGALGNILDDSKPWHQRVLGIFLPAKVGGKAEEVVTNPAIHKAASSAYGVAVDKLTGQVIDVTYEKYGSNQDKKQYSPVVNYQIPLVVIPKDPYDFSPLSR